MEQLNRATLSETEPPPLSQIVDDLVVRFAMLRTEEVDDAIVESLQQIAEALGVERGSLWNVGPSTDDRFVSKPWTVPEYRASQ